MSKQSADWCRKTAEQGDVKSQYELAVLHEYGIDVPKDYKEAVKWYRKAAAQGHAEAKFELDLIKQREDA